jgi:hypothetical protein
VSPSHAREDGAPVYQGVGTVLESTRALALPAHGPQLCLGPVLTSYPPQCGGPDIAGWDWNRAGGEQSYGGTTWGGYVVTGTFDGAIVTMTNPPRRPTAADFASNARPSFRTRCRPPAGRWIRRGQGNPHWNAVLGSAAIRYLTRRGDLGEYWVDRTGARTVVNVRVVRDVATHRTRLRRLFRGNLCVTQRGRSERVLGRILTQTIAALPPTNRLGGSVDIVDSHVDVDVVLDAGDLQGSFDARYGRGLVRVRSALVRVG